MTKSRIVSDAAKSRSRLRLLTSTAWLAGIGAASIAALPIDQAFASACNTADGVNGGTAVASGGTCVMPAYNPRDNDYKQGAAVATGGDTVTLTGSGSTIEVGNRGLIGNTLGSLDPSANGVERLLLGVQTQGVSTPDPITGANIVVATYNSANINASDWGQYSNSDTLTFVNVGDDQYVDARLGTAAGGKLIVNIGDPAQDIAAATNSINMAAKQTNLTAAEGAGSTVEWTSRNTISIGDIAQVAPGTTTRTVTMQKPTYAGTFTGFDGQTYTVTSVAELQSYNQALIAGLQAGKLSSQAAYDAAFAKAVTFTDQLATYSFTINVGDEATVAVGSLYSMYVDGVGANGIIKSGAQIDQRYAGVGVANGGHFEIENGGALSGHNNSLIIQSGGSAVNNGTISSGYMAGAGLDTTQGGPYVEAYAVNADGAGSTFDNNGIVNIAGWTYTGADGRDQYGVTLTNAAAATNSGIINVGVSNNALNGTISGVIVNSGSTFANTAAGTIYIGRAAQYDPSAPEAVADTANSVPQYGVVVNSGTAVNDGKIVIGSKTQNATAMLITATDATSSVVNNGTIDINGAAGGSPLLNTGLLALNTAATVTNNGTITLNGVNGIGLRAIGTTTATSITNSGDINIEGDADLASGTRNFGVWAEGAQASVAMTGGAVNLNGTGAIGVHARNGATIDISPGATVNFLSGTDQIGYFSYGAGTQINNSAGSLDVSTERSTLFRVEDGATFVGTGQDLTASGKDSIIIRGTGLGTTVDTADANLSLTGPGAIAVSIDGGATGTIRAITTVTLAGEGTVAGIVDGRKVNLSGVPSAEMYASTLTNEARIDSSADNAVGFITQFGGTLANEGVINLTSGVNNTGVIARSGGILNNTADITVANGTGILVEGAGSASQLTNDATITVNNGIAGIHIRDGAFLNAANSTGNIVAGGTAHGVLVGNGATGVLLGATTVTVNGTGNGIENAAEVSAIGFQGTTINVTNGAGIRTGTAIDPASTVTINVSGSGDGIAFNYADGSTTASDLALGTGFVINANGAGANGLNLNTTGNFDTSATVNVTNAAGGSAIVGGPANQIINRGSLISVSAAPVVDLTGGTKTFINTGIITAPAGGTAILGGNQDQTVAQMGGVITGLIDLGGGNDIYQQTAGTVNGSLLGGTGDDKFVQSGGAFNGPADLGDGNDGFALSNGTFTGALTTGNGNDVVLVSGGTLTGPIDLGAGDDIYQQTGGVVVGSLLGGTGNDQFTQSAGTFTGPADLGDGDDSFGLSGGAFTGAITMGNGKDVVLVSGGTLTGPIDLGAGDDAYQQTGGVVLGSLLGGTGKDSFLQSGGSFTGNADLGDGDDSFGLTGGTFTGALATGNGKDSALISGGVLTGPVDLGTDDDTFLMTGGKFAGTLTTGLGNDLAVFRGITDANIGGLTKIDGAGVAGGSDQLVFDNSQTTGTKRLTGWNEIGLINGSKLTSDGNVAMIGTAAFKIDATSIFAAGNGINGTIAATGGRLTVTNAGTIDLTNPNTNPVDRLTIVGDYVGQNGRLLIDTRLGTDGAPSDALYFDGSNGGAAATGLTTVSITNAGGLGANTNGDGILVIGTVNGATTTAQTSKSAFTLAGGFIDAGAYRYRLYAGDAAGGGENWYLRTREFRAETPLLTALPALLRSGDLDMLGTLHKRMGDDMQDMPAGDRASGRVWGRIIAADIHSTQQNISAPTTDGNNKGFQIGVDLFQSLNHDGGRHHVGVYGGYLESDARVYGFANQLYVGKLKPHTTYAGFYWTYTNPSGFYFDTVLQHSWYGGKETASTGVSSKIGGTGMAASVEAGYGVKLSKNWILEPQAQLIAQGSDLTGMEIVNATVTFHDRGSLTGRLGLRVRGDIALGETSAIKPYLRANLWHGFDGTQRTTFNGPAASTPFETPTGSTSGEVGGGFTLALNKTISFYGEVDHLFSIDKNANETRRGTSGSLGVKIDW